MSYDFSFDRKSAFLIVAGCLSIGTLLFLAGLVVGWDRGAYQARSQVEKENASKTASTAAPPLPLHPATGKAAASDSQKPSSGSDVPSLTTTSALPAKLAAAQPSPPATKQTSSKQGDEASTDAGAFSLQLGAFQSQDNAARLKKDLEARGYSAFVLDTLDAGGRVWHAVRVGHFPDLQKASAAAEAFAGKEKIPVVVRRGNEL